MRKQPHVATAFLRTEARLETAPVLMTSRVVASLVEPTAILIRSVVLAAIECGACGGLMPGVSTFSTMVPSLTCVL